MSKDAVVTIRDVARESGYSVSTVSIVLNNAPLARYIPTETKERIETTAKRLGYRPNPLARYLRSRRTNAVGVMVFDLTDPFCTPILRGIENSLYQASYLPVLADAHNEPHRFERYLEMLLDRRVEGLVVIANWLSVDINLLADLKRRRIPTVIVGREIEFDSICNVFVDNEAGARTMLEHLYRLGHRHIAFIRGPKTLLSSAQRWKGIRQFAQSVNLKINTRLVVEMPETRDPNLSFEAGEKLTENLLRHGRAFTALLAYDDMAALGAMRALLRRGVRVPEQCSIAGFDDVAQAALSVPSLTTIRQPMEAMGAIGVGLVLDWVAASNQKRESPIVSKKVAAELVVRESTHALK